MYKYKYFLLFFCAIAALLLWCFFPVCFDNNDDQVMYSICSGIISGMPSPNLILSNIIIGKSISTLFSYSKNINWYTFYLQLAQLLSFLFICRIFINHKKSTFLNAVFVVSFFYFGFYSLSTVKLQFTTVALFCCFAALFSLQIKESNFHKILYFSFFIILSILIRKEIFYIFILFSLPIIIIEKKAKNFIVLYCIVIAIASLVFYSSYYLDTHNKLYNKQQTYSNINALDIIAAKPIKINEDLLLENKFTENDITLLQSWLVADDAYLSGNIIEQLAIKLKTKRDFMGVKVELIKFSKDERYLLLIYVMTVLFVLLFSHQLYRSLALNLIVFLLMLLYLSVTSRIPHRVTFPLLTYLVLINIFLLMESDIKIRIKSRIFFLLLIVSTYKFYCTTKLIAIHTQYHKIFSACRNEVNAHPDNLFIAADNFPLQYMDAWQSPEKNFPVHNLILTGWYACSPDYQTLMKLNHLKNLTSDLKTKNNVLFLTNSAQLQNSYIGVMKERYNINCHFEEQTEGFKALHPKRIVFDN